MADPQTTSQSGTTVPFFAPDGTLGDVPYERMHEAVQRGGIPGVNMRAPDGSTGVIPANRVQDAVQKGGTVIPIGEKVPAAPQKGWWGALAEDAIGALHAVAPVPSAIADIATGTPIKQVASNVLKSVVPALRSADTIKNLPSADAERKAESRSIPYRVVAPMAEMAGSNVPGEEEGARQGDVGAVAGHFAAGEAPYVAGLGLGMAEPTITRVLRGKPTAPPAPEASARELTQAVNPPVNEWPGYMKANETELGNIREFANRNGLPLKTQLDYAKAARAAAKEAQAHFQGKLLGPIANESVDITGTGYRGKFSGDSTSAATLGDINKRIGAINDELRSAYTKRETGQTREALANDADLKAEQGALANLLNGEIASRTGLMPEDVANVRQRFGKMYSIADQTEGAINQRQSSTGKAREGRRDVPTTAAQVGVEAFNRLVRGGPEGIGNRAFRKALGRAGSIQSSPLPEPNAPVIVQKLRTPVWGSIPPEETGAPEPAVLETTPAEKAAQLDKLAMRRAANQSATKNAEQEKANLGTRKAFNLSKHGSYKTRQPYD